MSMSKHARTKLATQRPMPEKQALQANKEPIREQQEDHSMLSELDTEIECPRLWSYIPNSTNWFISVTTVVSC
jgi:hypothetical protein